jgi:hypothetical protein
VPRLSRKDEARPGRRPSEGQYLSMPQLQGGHDGRGLGRERFLRPVAHVQAEIKKSFVERARLARAAPIQQLPPFPVFNQILRIHPALGIKLLAFGERRSHVEAIARGTHAGAERKFKRCQRWEFYRL